MKLSDAQLKESMRDAEAAMERSAYNWAAKEAFSMAQELLAARKVVEAARHFKGYTRGIDLGKQDGPPTSKALKEALTAYDKTLDT